MAWVRRGYELAFLFLGRPVRPFHLAITIATLTVAFVNILGTGLVLYGETGDVIGGIALIAGITLIWAWWKNYDRLAEWGLLLAAGVWTARAIFGLLTTSDNPWAVFMLSMAWAVGAAGAYLLEHLDHADETEGA